MARVIDRLTELVGSAVTALGYELVVLVAGGQFWRVPNQLAGERASQATRFHFDRVSR